MSTVTMEVGNERLLKVAQALYETEHAKYFTMHLYATTEGYPCDALANFAFRQDLQDFLEIDGQAIKYINGDYAHWGDDAILNYFHITYRVSESLFSSYGDNSISETPEAAGDFIQKTVSQRMENIEV